MKIPNPALRPYARPSWDLTIIQVVKLSYGSLHRLSVNNRRISRGEMEVGLKGSCKLQKTPRLRLVFYRAYHAQAEPWPPDSLRFGGKHTTPIQKVAWGQVDRRFLSRTTLQNLVFNNISGYLSILEVAPGPFVSIKEAGPFILSDGEKSFFCPG